MSAVTVAAWMGGLLLFAVGGSTIAATLLCAFFLVGCGMRKR